MNDKERMAEHFVLVMDGKITREEALQIERQNARQRLKWAEEARVGRAMVEAAESKRERRRQRNIRLQENIDKSVD